MQEAGVLDGAESDGVTEFVDTFRPDIMEVVYEWTKGKKFVEVCKINDKLFEGTIIRAMRRLEEFMKQMCLAAKVIGDNALEAKFREAIVALKRVRCGVFFGLFVCPVYLGGGFSCTLTVLA